MALEQSSSPYPTITPWPTATPYPTASGTPTMSPWPTMSLFPTDSLQPADFKSAEAPSSMALPGARSNPLSPAPSSEFDIILDQFLYGGGKDSDDSTLSSPAPTISYYPTVTAYPTASGTPTMSPWPTLSLSPTESLEPAPTLEGKAGGRNDDTPPTPPSTLDTMVEKFIQDGIDNRPAPTASPAPSISTHPTSTAYPTASPTPTTSPFPTSSLYPTFSVYPTASPAPTISPFPTSSPDPTLTRYPSASPTPTASPFPTLVEEDDGDRESYNDAVVADSVGYGQSCFGFEKGPHQIEEKVVFTYTAEARTTSPDFLTELEIHLLDHATSEALECDANSELHIYEIRYPKDAAASDATTCDATYAASKACWILRTTMYITTDRATKTRAKYTVLEDIQKQLNNGNLLAKTFKDLSHTQYLGPDPVETSFSRSPEIATSIDFDPQENNPILLYAIIAVSLAVISVFFFFGLLIYTKRNKSSVRGKEEESEGSIEITELLSKSRERLKNHSPRQPLPSHFRESGYEEKNVEQLLSSKSSKRDDRVSRSAGSKQHRENNISILTDSKNDAMSTVSGSTRATGSAASRYQKARQSTAREAASTNGSTLPARSSASSKSLRAPSSSRGSRSHSLFEDPVAQAEERRAFQKGKNNNSSSNTNTRTPTRGKKPSAADKLGDTSIV